jgi:hypothetical protein
MSSTTRPRSAFLDQDKLTGISCPKCDFATRVMDSRPGPEGENSIRRRRLCCSSSCGHRFTTYELVGEQSPAVSPAAMLVLIEQLERAAQILTDRVAILKGAAQLAGRLADES